MKKSEFLASRVTHRRRLDALAGCAPLWRGELYYERRAAEEAEAAEAAGIVWDHEGPGRLAVDWSDAIERPCHVHLIREADGSLATHREHQAAADSYNRRGVVAEVAAEMRRRASRLSGAGIADSLVEWADRLDGA